MGKAVFDDNKQFEFVILESAQAGLSWRTVLVKREGYRKAFADFNAEKVASFDAKKIEELMQDKSIVRNKLKINAAVTNARIFLDIQAKYGSFTSYLWGFNNGKQIVNYWKNISQVPAQTVISENISNDLKKRGFKFFGPTIVYAYMQAVGMVNDHLVSCFRHQDCIHKS